MPGSPPTRMALAGTSPPPNTRSSSAMPEPVRGGGDSVAERSVRLIWRPRFVPSDLEAGPEEMGASSVMVFHSPQASQRPDHLEKDAPQAEQEKVPVFAMSASCPMPERASNPYSAAVLLDMVITLPSASTMSSCPSSGRRSRMSSRRRLS